MKRTAALAKSKPGKAGLDTLCVFLAVWLPLSLLTGCGRPAPSQAETKAPRPEIVTLVHQPDGSQLMEVSNAQLEEGPVGTLKQVQIPGGLEATGQVTFDDKLVSTIISRLTGRIEEMRSSEWQMVRRGELVMKVYSPDYMSAEAEYLSAALDGATRTPTETFGISAGLSMATSLREAAIRKLELLGFSASEIAAIRTPSPSVWVRAPISGIIVSKNVVRGQAINPGDQLLALATLQRVWITADIYQNDLASVYVGQPLTAVTASYPGNIFKGTVQRISPALDPNIHTLQLRCQVDNPGSLLKPQMLARVRLLTKGQTAYIVPQSALVFDDSGYFAFVLAGPNRIERRKVQIADWSELGSEPAYFRVVSGIRPGEKFLTTEALKFNALWHQAHGKAS